MNPRSALIQAGDRKVAVQIEGAGIDVVLVHGLMGNRDTWYKVRPLLVGRGFRVVVPELIGFGLSDRAGSIDDLWLNAQARALEATCRELGVSRAIFVGHDYGGPTLVELWRRAPDLVSGLVLASCNLTNDTPIPFPLSTWSWPVLGPLLRRLVLSRPSMAFSIKQAVHTRNVRLPVADYLGDPAQFRAIQTIFSHAILELAERYREVHKALSTIGVPVEVLWGEQDPFFSVDQGRRMAAEIPHSSFTALAGCGHFTPEEAPTAVAQCVVRLAALTGVSR